MTCKKRRLINIYFILLYYHGPMEIRKRHYLFGLGLVVIGIGAVLRAFTLGRLYFDFDQLFFYHTSHPLNGLGIAVEVLGVLMLLPFLLLTLFALYKSRRTAKLEKQKLIDEARAKRAQERAQHEAAQEAQTPEGPEEAPSEPAKPSWRPPPLSPSGEQ
jgi:hypothetical protein